MSAKTGLQLTIFLCLLPLLLDEVKSALEFQLEFSAFGQVQFMAAAGFHKVCGDGARCGGFGGFALVAVFNSFNGTESGACGGGFRGAFLGAGAALDHPFPFWATGADAMVARNAGNFGHDWERAEAGVDLVERKPQAGAPGDSGGLHSTDVAANLGANWKEDATSGFQGLKGVDPKPAIFACPARVQLIFQPNQELGARSDRVRFDREVGRSATVGRFTGVGGARAVLGCRRAVLLLGDPA